MRGISLMAVTLQPLTRKSTAGRALFARVIEGACVRTYPDRADETGHIIVNRDGVVPLGREGQHDHGDPGAGLQRRGLNRTGVSAMSGVVLFLRGHIIAKVIL